jgi:DNA-binding LytR/AlgR family response regulator
LPASSEVRALLADDEANVRFYLKRQLEDLWPELSIVAEAANGEEALRLIETEQPAVVFLDIRMPGLTGLQVAERIGNAGLDCQIVFVTAHDEYAVKAFEQAAADYVLKPVSAERLAKTVARVRERLQSATPTDTAALLKQLSAVLTPAATVRYLRWIKASLRDEVRIVPVQEVLYFQSDEKYTSVVTAREELVIRKPVKELEQELDPEKFWRIHRSVIVNVAYIERTHQDFRGHLLLRLRGRDVDLPVSRSFAHRFKQM